MLPQSSDRQDDKIFKARVLIVEDDLNLLEGIQTVLELDNYSVISVENGKQALAVLRESTVPPDLIVSDIMMPQMDGIQLLREVRSVQEWIKIPFIFLTARSEKSDIQRGKQLGVDDYLVKPFDADDLLIAVESRLNRHKALNAIYDDAMSSLKRNILTILNHEFRTPLTFVVAYADMLNDDTHQLSNEEMLTFLHGVNTGALRLRRLIENFIVLVEMETGDAQRSYEIRKAAITDLEGMIEGARQEVFNLTRFTQPFSLQIEPDLPTFVGDALYLRMALVQLIDNAVKFSEGDAAIVCGAARVGDEVHLWVQDHGRGIENAEQGHIWEMFYQIDRSKYEDQGTGSGLAIVDHITRLHNGHAEVTSQPNEGSTFTICLPMT
ncbi:MAG TPA: hybrid sensor histidine kinase/response regulator [Phototrophicaceae bacterium]|nr:hybrid sensor histidine kinase/response regulator [Phototrophicaceae bacterium]